MDGSAQQPLWWGALRVDGKSAVILDFPINLTLQGLGWRAGKPPTVRNILPRVFLLEFPLSVCGAARQPWATAIVTANILRGSSGKAPGCLVLRLNVSQKDFFLTMQDKVCGKNALLLPDERIIKKNMTETHREVLA